MGSIKDEINLSIGPFPISNHIAFKPRPPLYDPTWLSAAYIPFACSSLGIAFNRRLAQTMDR